MQKYETIKEINRDRHQQYLNVQREAEGRFVKNNKAYEEDTIIYGTVGVLVRIVDKIKRLSTITKNSIHLENDELIRDTLFDIQNLACHGIILLDEDEPMKDHYTGEMRNMIIESANKPRKSISQSLLNTFDDLKQKVDETMNISKLYRSKTIKNFLNFEKNNKECQIQDSGVNDDNDSNDIFTEDTFSNVKSNTSHLPKEYDEGGMEIEVKYDENNDIIHDLFPYNGTSSEEYGETLVETTI